MSTFDPEEGDLLGYYAKPLEYYKFCILVRGTPTKKQWGNWSKFPKCLLSVKSFTWVPRRDLLVMVPKNYL